MPPGTTGAVDDGAGGFPAGSAPRSRAGSTTGCSAAKLENSPGNAGTVGPGTAAYGFTLTGDPGGTGAAGATDKGGWSASGNAVKNALAMRANSTGSRTPAVRPSVPCGVPCDPFAKSPLPGITAEVRLASLVLMVLSHVYVFEQGNGVIGKHGGGAVQRNQV